MMRISMVLPIASDTMLTLAKLAISIARKIGAVIFLLPEDITQVRARLVPCLSYVTYLRF